MPEGHTNGKPLRIVQRRCRAPAAKTAAAEKNQGAGELPKLGKKQPHFADAQKQKSCINAR